MTEKQQHQRDALRYVTAVIVSRAAFRRTADYLAGLKDVQISVDAAIERLEAGEDIHPYATVQTRDAEPCERWTRTKPTTTQ